ncbi:MAG: hypothetical protein ABJE47_24625 [bacterium]
MIAPALRGQFPVIRTTADGVRAFNNAWPKFERVVMWYARRLTESEFDLADLRQEAMIYLCELDSHRFDFRDKRDVNYVTKCLIRRVVKAWGAKRGDDMGNGTELDDAAWQATKACEAEFGSLGHGPRSLYELCGYGVGEG